MVTVRFSLTYSRYLPKLAVDETVLESGRGAEVHVYEVFGTATMLGLCVL